MREWNVHMQEWFDNPEAFLISKDINKDDYRTYVAFTRDPAEVFLVSSISVDGAMTMGKTLSVTEESQLIYGFIN